MPITWGPAGSIYANIDINTLSPEQRAQFDATYGGGGAQAFGTGRWAGDDGGTAQVGAFANSSGVGGMSAADLAAARSTNGDQINQWAMPAATPAASAPAVNSLQRAAEPAAAGSSGSGPSAPRAAASAAPAAAAAASGGGGGGGGVARPAEGAPSMRSLRNAGTQSPAAQIIEAPESIRGGIGQRIYPQYSSALAALQKAVY